MTDVSVHVEHLDDLDGFEEAAELYRSVFGYGDTSHAVNPRLLRSLVVNGGSVVGARADGGPADGRLVGFAYGFVGTDGRSTYHYSQAAVVDHRYQGKGIGRLLKMAQRDAALASGQTRMRWAFDPALARNAHFNLDVLGAVGRWFEKDFYGMPGTDRLVVDWDLTREPPAEPTHPVPPGIDAAATQWWQQQEVGGTTWITVPTDVRTGAGARERIGPALKDLLDAGYVVVTCDRVAAETAAYGLVREVGR